MQCYIFSFDCSSTTRRSCAPAAHNGFTQFAATDVGLLPAILLVEVLRYSYLKTSSSGPQNYSTAMASVIITGDSFIRRLESHINSQDVLHYRPDLSTVSYKHRFSDGRSVQSISRLLQADMHEFQKADLHIYHLGGNDISNQDVDAVKMAEDLYTFVTRVLDITGTPRASIMPITYRFGMQPFSFPTCHYRRLLDRITLPSIERDFNRKVDLFNSTLHSMVHAQLDPRIRYGKLKGLNTRESLSDGTHIKPSCYHRYARAMLEEIIMGVIQSRPR